MTTRPKVPAPYFANLAGVNPGIFRRYAHMLMAMEGFSSPLEEQEMEVRDEQTDRGLEEQASFGLLQKAQLLVLALPGRLHMQSRGVSLEGMS
jgi:hypothetical protein